MGEKLELHHNGALITIPDDSVGKATIKLGETELAISSSLVGRDFSVYCEDFVDTWRDLIRKRDDRKLLFETSKAQLDNSEKALAALLALVSK